MQVLVEGQYPFCLYAMSRVVRPGKPAVDHQQYKITRFCMIKSLGEIHVSAFDPYLGAVGRAHSATPRDQLHCEPRSVP